MFNFNDDFIEIYDNALSKSDCERLIDLYEKEDEQKKCKGNASKFFVAKKVATTLPLNIRSEYHSLYNCHINPLLIKYIKKYKQKYQYLDNQEDWTVSSNYNFQKYEDGEGYYSLHHEHSCLSPYRMLVWMVYLNNAESGTEFSHQKKIIKPKTGRLVIWPAAWTHAHKGVTPNRGKKYIVTGWFSYLPVMDEKNKLITGLD